MDIIAKFGLYWVKAFLKDEIVISDHCLYQDSRAFPSSWHA